MKITGLIAEYNPFHNGHQYHIEKARQMTNADAVIVVMSGNFVQRGVPAIMPKHLRARAAFMCGADLVIELPVCYATASAEIFAMGAVSLLKQLGCVDAICFGSECGDIEILKKLSKFFAEEPYLYQEHLQSYLRAGNNFPLARQKAIIDFFQGDCVQTDFLQTDALKTIMESPNNILGMEYIKALYKLNSSIEPFTIQRMESDYHDIELRQTYSSASAIRKSLAGNNSPNSLEQHIPASSVPLFTEHYLKRYPIYTDDLSLLLKFKLLNETKSSLVQYLDVSTELANRILNMRNQFISFEQFCNALKTKEITYARISRALLHILLNIKKEDYLFSGYHGYIHVLGFRKDSTQVLSEIKQHASLPLLTKLCSTDSLTSRGLQMLNTDIFASDLYESIITEKFKTPFINEYEHQIIRI